MEENADKEYYNLIKPMMLAAKFVAFWPLKRNHSTSAKMFRICHMIWLFFVLCTMAIAVIADIIHNLDDLDEMIACALMESFFCLGIIRFIVFSWHHKDVSYIVKTMEEDWTCSSYEDRIILKKKCFFAFWLAKCFAIMVTLTVIAFICTPILEVYIFGKKKIFPFRGYFFINQTVSPVYESLYIINAMGGCFCSGTIISATAFSLITVMHGAAKFAVLRKKLEAINSKNRDADKAVVYCVKNHQDAIIFADTVENTINILALAQFVISTGLVCFAGFQVTSMLENKTRLMKYSMFLNSAIVELYMFSFSGNALIDESDAVGESAYCSYWIGGTFSRTLQIVMMRSNVPSKITAAKFYSMSLKSFSQVLSTSFSYIMVLMTVKEE